MAKQQPKLDYPGLEARFFHSAATVGDSLFVWAGDQAGLPKVHDSIEKRKFTNTIQHFTASSGQWFARETTGTSPLGVTGYYCAAINDYLYYFGGYCNHDNCFHNSITQLDTISLRWRELKLTDATRPVMRRGCGGMLSFEHDREHYLLMIGGIGSKPAVQLPDYKYIESKLHSGRWRTNEHSMYNLSSGKWGNILIIGECIPPADGFIIEKISSTRAILFGGIVQDDKTEATANMYLLNIDLSLSTVSWQYIKKPEAIDQWPVGRFNHASAIIVTELLYPMLVICGGMNNNNDMLDDCWIFNTTQRTWTTWTKLGIHHSFSKRWAHSLSVFTLSPRCFWIITVGGASVSKREVTTDELVPSPYITVIKSLIVNNEKIIVQNIPLSNNQQYQSTYYQQLQLGRTHWLEHQKQKEKLVQVLPSSAQEWQGHQLTEYKTLLKEQELETQAIKQQLRKEQDHRQQLLIELEKKEAERSFQLQEKELIYHHQLQENKAQKEREIQKICFQLQEKLEREKAAKDLEIQNYHYQLLEKEKMEALKIQEYLQQLQQKEAEILNYFNQLQERNQEIQEYCHQLEQVQVSEAEKDLEIQRCYQEIQKYQYQLQEKEKADAISKQKMQQLYHQQLQEKEQESLEKEKEKQKYHQKLQKTEKDKTETKQKHSLQLSEKETEIEKYRKHLKKEEAEKEQCHLQLKENEKKYIQQLQVKDKELSENKKYHQLQLQENEAKMKQKLQNYDHKLQKMKKELEDKEKEIQILNQLICKEQREKDKEIQQLLQQIQQYKHQIQGNDKCMIEKERAKEKIQEIRLLHSSQIIFDEQKEQVPMMPSKQKVEQCNEKTSESLPETGDELKGVHVADKKSFLIQSGSNQSLSVNWEEYGIRITIPQGAVLPSETVQITINALVGGDFVFPEDTELISAVYAISLSKPFLEPVKLEVQHCVSITTPAHSNYLSFSTATNNQPPFQFNTVDGGEFSIGNRYGSISIAKFSKWSVVMKRRRRTRMHPYRTENLSHKKEHKSLSVSSSSQSSTNVEESFPNIEEPLEKIPLSSSRTIDASEQNQLMIQIPVEILEDESPVKLYFGQVIYEVRKTGREWLMRFLLCQDLNALVEHIKKVFKSFEENMEIAFEFENCHDGCIELQLDDRKCPKGWSVRPHQKPSKVRT
ncbi:PREDICTED: uncharacterized protein LOC109586177 isoform X2 [Amphimedon queenslandica]|uniref:ZU5 domain-containing protein n=1 Tax=Amphimedon queenslandica TaxID=400682 RepID=A0AAN0JMI5_AMPQE|nr:PREDICTED: uncharacterized protein LOC109586177 isoform X2 [Amphimedon queenslandica]|eukprot:XP_019857992.1 PREDICTED: uncharacterized protein LOC109586177 isoform X2 [Amphimedon queenslandica]